MSRKWETDDTKWFFEALCEHGKDFQSIQTYIASRSERKKGPQKCASSNECIKSREQVRHYYYRTWHKIASSLYFNEDIFQQTKELYGLINYGEIWKKFGSKFDSKIKTYLNELVFNGQTIAKVKGKNVKLKTPVCKALKRIHKLEDSKTSSCVVDISNLPKEVYVELHPTNNDAWMRVHSLSQNPRVRTKLPLQKRLSSLMSYLQKRWSESRLRSTECENLSIDFNDTSRSCSVFTVRPHPSITNDLKAVTIKRIPINFNAQVDVSLSAFIEKMYKNSEIEKKPKKSNAKNVKPVEGVDSTNEVIEGEGIKEKLTQEIVSNDVTSTEYKNGEPTIVETVRSLSLLNDMLSSVETASEQQREVVSNGDCQMEIECNHVTVNNVNSVNNPLPLPPANATIGEWLSANITETAIEKISESNAQQVADTPVTSCLEKFDELTQSIDLQTLKKGWNIETSNLTIGELYLMLERPNKILLEYEWVPKEIKDTTEKQTCDVDATCESQVLH
ncbi:hypothetical protein B4U80_03335 [Leptotrombidium deliense]|uniref:SANT domain-containing protein n=1 Tax=Leptotrombidium deliense TaxID=299467 RepID=A0A443S869_9ACAR|nr:hypothetical protein B4U80_03335 [Leptotrombidium deliense]